MRSQRSGEAPDRLRSRAVPGASVLTLAISTASPALSLALFDGTDLVAHDHRVIGRGHAEALVPAIAALMGERRAAAIIVDVGPGSFTGIRIGIAAARALGLAWGAAVTGCTAINLVAARVFAANPGLTAVAVRLDGGRGQLFCQDVAADYDAGPIAILSGTTEPESEPDAAFALHLPPRRRTLAPRALYVRPTDAILPL